MANKKAKGKAAPGKSVTRRVSRGPNKGDTVKFKANRKGTQNPGKLVPRKLIKDRGKKNITGLPRAKKKKKK